MLVISRSGFDREHEQDIIRLHELLYETERMAIFCNVTEIVDMNRYKIRSNPNEIRRVVAGKTLRPFVFLFNKN